MAQWLVTMLSTITSIERMQTQHCIHTTNKMWSEGLLTVDCSFVFIWFCGMVTSILSPYIHILVLSIQRAYIYNYIVCICKCECVGV